MILNLTFYLIGCFTGFIFYALIDGWLDNRQEAKDKAEFDNRSTKDVIP